MTTVTDAETFENQLKKTIAPNKIRNLLLDNDYLSDVTFVLGSEQLRAHKMFLVTASPIFHKLFESDLEQHMNVKIQNISKSTMLEICRYAYTDTLTLTQVNVLDILHAASRFEMRNLIEKCVDFVSKLLSERNVFLFLIENQKHNNFRVNMKCFEFIDKNHQKCLKSPDFVKISNELLRTILATCKVPKDPLAAAIRNWAKVNDTTDLEELLALVSLHSAEQQPSQPPAETENKKKTRSRSQTKVFTNKAMQAPEMFFDLSIVGRTTRKAFKYANLDLLVVGRIVVIHEIQFLYDLRQFDEQYEISIWRVDESVRSKLFNQIVRINAPSVTYKLPLRLEIAPFAKIWISVEFPKAEFRFSYDEFFSLNAHALVLRKEPNSYAQIISRVLFSVKP